MWTTRRSWMYLAALLTLSLSACAEDLTVPTTSADAGSDLAPEDIALTGTDATVEQPDTVAQDTLGAGTDATALDGASDGNTTGACPGGAGCACAQAGDCDSGVCVETANGKQCATPCSGNACPNGFGCKILGTTDQVSVCVPLHLTICAPCQKNTDCQAQGANDAWCLDRGAEGAYCGGACTSDADCPDTYQCSEGKPIGGGAAAKACQPKASAACTCSAWAIKLGVATSCQTVNAMGACGGKRNCTAAGLTACDGAQAKGETCNGADDNCNGKIDDLNAGAGCLKKAFDSKGSDKACTADSDCATGEGCHAGKCKILIGACPGKATCTSSGEELCLDAKTPSYELCNGQDDDCDGATDETACDDKDPCTADACNAVKGLCEHTATVDCDDKNPCTADSCDKTDGGCQHKLSAGTSCNDGDACTVGDLCGSDAALQPACLPGPSAAKCDDGNLCTDDGCVPSKGCIALPNAATESCYDGPGTTLDVGVCHAGKKVCKAGVLSSCTDQNLPAAKEACDGLDDNCNGQVDEQCKGDNWSGGLVAIAAVSAGNQTVVQISSGGPSAVGEAAGKNGASLWAGFARWLLNW